MLGGSFLEIMFPAIDVAEFRRSANGLGSGRPVIGAHLSSPSSGLL